MERKQIRDYFDKTEPVVKCINKGGVFITMKEKNGTFENIPIEDGYCGDIDNNQTSLLTINKALYNLGSCIKDGKSLVLNSWTDLTQNKCVEKI